MRRLGFPLLLALFSACTVTTTGAPCASDLNCPSDQGCGSDGTCSTAALSCPGHTESGQCVPGTSCDSGRLVTCSAGAGVCSTGPITSECPVHQECATAGGSASCACILTRCGPSTPSVCTAAGELASCAQDLSTPGACWYEASSAACADPGTACVESGGAATCACPAADACTPLDSTRCSATGDQILRCLPVVAGSACLTWQPGTSCSEGGLVCSASECVCPANPGPTFVADPVGGSRGGAAPRPTGLLSPVACRFQTLTEALAAANARGAGSTVMAAGWSAGLPGGTVLFSEPGALVAGAGVTLTTDDPAPMPGHYAITTSATLTVPLVEIGPGGAMSGFELRNAASSGDGVRVSCPTSVDTLPASLSAIRITAASAGTPVARLAAGVSIPGHCGVSMSDVVVEGAETGVLVNTADPGVVSTATTPRVTGSTVAGVALVEGTLTFTGGSVDGNASGVLVGTTGTGAPSLSATGTTFGGNSGDAIHVARGTVFTDACPYVNNGTHVHVEPAIGSTVGVTVQNSKGAAKMTGASDSAFRVIAAGIAANSSVSILGNDISQNGAIQTYTLGTSLRRGGGLVFTFPMPGTVAFEGNTVASNHGDQLLVAASAGALDLRGGTACESASNNTLGCYDSGTVGIYSNGTAVQIDRNHWTQQPAAPTVDYAGSGITGASSVCTPSVLVCP